MLSSLMTKTINRYLDMDPEVAERLSVYEGKILQIELLPFKTIFSLEIQSHHISVIPNHNTTPDVKISGTPLNLLNAWCSKKFDPENLAITGDVSLLQELKNIFDAIEIDWAEVISHFTGDSIAHTGSQVFSTLTRIGKNMGKNVRLSLTEYLQEEKSLLVPRAELRDFYKSVDEIRDQVERLQVRLELISP